MVIPGVSIPDYLPGEPPSRTPPPLRLAWLLLGRAARTLVTALLSAPFWIPYLLLRVFLGRPPNVASAGRFLEILRLILVVHPQPDLSLGMRLGLLLELGFRAALVGPLGLAWLLDEVLYGRALREIQIREPIFELSAARSGSTQLAHYLEDDPGVVGPNVIQIAFPYLWLWRLAPRLEWLMSRQRLAHAVFASQPHEYHERHESDALRTDTFEIAYGLAHQLIDLPQSLGPDVMLRHFRFDRVAEGAVEAWAKDFPDFIDGIARRTLLQARRVPGGERRHFFIKGHFLFAAPELARRYPDARFLTMLRAPEKRLQSLLNFYRCQATVFPCPAIPWPWIIERTLESEVGYCDVEMAWFQQAEGPRRCIVPFDAYLRDLDGTMRYVYRVLLDREVSPHVPREHAPRVRTNYSVDRSLAQLGVDEQALKQRLAAYGAWCRTGIPPA